MKFIRREGDPSIIWDKERNRPLCEFTSGVFETSDKWSIDKLMSLGFECDGHSPVVSEMETVDEEPESEELETVERFVVGREEPDVVVIEQQKKRGRKKGK